MIRNKKINLAWLLLASATLTLSAQEPTEEQIKAEELELFRIMGYAMAQQLQLHIGYDEDELDAIFEGMRAEATGEEPPENFRESLMKVTSLYTARQEQHRVKQEAEAAKLASKNKEEGEAFLAKVEQREGVQKTESGLLYEILEEGDGDYAGASDRVTVNYRGTLIDGREFDANQNVEFMLNRVVPGFSEGLRLVRPGGKIKLYFPSELGYGDRPQRPGSIIEPGSALIFEVELLEISETPAAPMRANRPPAPPNVTPPPPPSNLRPPSGSPPPPPSSRPDSSN